MSKSVWLVYMTSALFNDHRISSQKLFDGNQRIPLSNLINNIGRQGGALMEDPRGQVRLRNAHTTVTILFEIFWHSIYSFISILTLQLMFQPFITELYMVQCMPELVFRKLMPAKALLKRHTMKTYIWEQICKWMKYFDIMLWTISTQMFTVFLCHKDSVIYLDLLHVRNIQKCIRFPFMQILHVSISDHFVEIKCKGCVHPIQAN